MFAESLTYSRERRVRKNKKRHRKRSYILLCAEVLFITGLLLIFLFMWI